MTLRSGTAWWVLLLGLAGSCARREPLLSSAATSAATSASVTPPSSSSSVTPLASTTAPAPLSSAGVGSRALPCPPPNETSLESDSAPPWERDPLGRWPQCLETQDGARVRATKDPTDPDGWRAFLVAEDVQGTRYNLPIRAVSAMGLARNGSVALAHVEDKVTFVSTKGEVLWSSSHPHCGAPEVSVSATNEVVLGCGFSLLKFASDGRFLWQKWPLGNTRISKPLVLADGSMIMSGGGVVARTDADGEVTWKLDTGPNRQVHKIGALANGDIIFRTSMAAMHSNGPIRAYFPREPAELFVVTRDGKTVSRQTQEGAPDTSAPKTVPWSPELRSGRI